MNNPKLEDIWCLSDDPERLADWIDRYLKEWIPPPWMLDRLGERPVDLVEHAYSMVKPGPVRKAIAEATLLLLDRVYIGADPSDDSLCKYMCQILHLVEVTNTRDVDATRVKNASFLVWWLARDKNYCQKSCDYAVDEYAHLLRTLAQLQYYQPNSEKEKLTSFWRSIFCDDSTIKYAQVAFTGLRRSSLEAAAQELLRAYKLAERSPNDFDLTDALRELNAQARREPLGIDRVMLGLIYAMLGKEWYIPSKLLTELEKMLPNVQATLRQLTEVRLLRWRSWFPQIISLPLPDKYVATKDTL